MTQLWFALGWTPGALTGWGTFGVGFARSLHEAGFEVRLPGGIEEAGILPLDRPLFRQLVRPMPMDTDGWLFVPLGNGLEAKPDYLTPNIKTCGLCVFEDAGALDDAAVERLKSYDQLIAPSRWVQGLLQAKGLDVPVCHQGYDGRVFFPAKSQGGTYHIRSETPRPHVFSGGKLEFRKGQDIVVEAFRRFRSTPEGANAVLVVCWDNPWPRTMDGIWLSGYVKGVPTVKNGKADVTGWLEINGIPREAVIDAGRLSPPEMAQLLRSCDVGVFPSRCEGATNLVMVEAIASGLPCIVSKGHGHQDAPRPWETPTSLDAVPIGCRLYKSTDGWTEADPGAIAGQLVQFAQEGAASRWTFDAGYWDWRDRGPAIAGHCLPVAV